MAAYHNNHVQFSWDIHVGSQTPQEFASYCDSGSLEEFAANYIDGVISGEVFGEPINLDRDDSIQSIVDAIRQQMELLKELEED